MVLQQRTLIRLMPLFLMILLPCRSFAGDYALAMPTFLAGKCSVVVWIHGVGESRKIEYKGSLHEPLCNVEVPRAVFEKDFKYCVLSGVEVTSGNKPFYAEFGGGPAGDREIYWFEWRNAGEVFPTFYCFYK